MKRVLFTLMTITLLCSCEKASSVSEKYVGNWEGLLYAISENGDDKILSAQKIIELTIEKTSSYTCIIYAFQSPTGIPIKVGEGSTYKGKVIEEGEHITLSEPFPDNRFKSLETPDGLRLQSSEFLINLKKQHISHVDELRNNGQEH